MGATGVLHMNEDKKEVVYSLLGIIIIVIIMAVVGSAYFSLILHNQEEDTKIYLGEVTKQMASSVDNQIKGDMNILYALASAIGSEDNIDTDNMLETFYRECVSSPFLRMGFAFPDGTCFSAGNEKVYGEIANVSNEDFFKNSIKGKQFISNIVKDKYSDGYINYFAVPVYHVGKVCGVIYGVHRIDTYEKVLNLSAFDGNGAVFITNKKGDVIVSSDHDNNDKPHLNIFESESGLKDIYEDVIVDMKYSKSDTFKLEKYHDSNIWISYSPISSNGWYLVSAVTFEDINIRTKNIFFMAFAAFVLICIFLLVFTVYVICLFIKNKKIFYKISYVDELTGIRNKKKFIIDMDETLKNNKNIKYAVIVLDIDNFKTINEIFGFDYGNRILIHTAKVIQKNLNPGEMVSRDRGDDFYIFMQYDTRDDIKIRLKKIQSGISAFQIKMKGQTYYEIISYCGVYRINPKNYERGGDFLIDRANMAYMRINRNHSNGYAFYNDEVRSNIVFQTELENDMQYAIENDEFIVYIQPKYELATERIAGAEALVRWQHHEKGFLTPDKFISVFEKNGFITKLDMYVLEKVCEKQKQWIEQGITPVTISINQSRLHLFIPDYVEELKSLIDKYNIPYDLIEVEITENVAFESLNTVNDIINQLHNIGFKVSMDDFGSGYSSLNMLKNVDVDVLKIDREFLEETSNSKKGREIISSVLDMAKRLNISTVSEGVETIEQVKFLQECGCDMAQGFYYSKPLPIDEFEKRLIESNKINLKE